MKSISLELPAGSDEVKSIGPSAGGREFGVIAIRLGDALREFGVIAISSRMAAARILGEIDHQTRARGEF